MLLLLLFFTSGKPLLVKKLQKEIQIVWQCTLLWSVVIINKTVMQQNDAQTSPVVSTNRLPSLLKN